MCRGNPLLETMSNTMLDPMLDPATLAEAQAQRLIQEA